MRHQRKPAKVRVGKASAPVPDIPLQEPILITDVGKVVRPWSSQRACEHGDLPSEIVVRVVLVELLLSIVLLYGPASFTVRLRS